MTSRAELFVETPQHGETRGGRRAVQSEPIKEDPRMSHDRKSARRKNANSSAKWLAMPLVKLFRAKPMPELENPLEAQPSRAPAFAIVGQ